MTNEELLAVLGEALAEREADVAAALAEAERVRAAIAALGEVPSPINIAKISGYVGMPSLPLAAVPKDAGRNSTKIECPRCGRTFKAFSIDDARAYLDSTASAR